MKDEYKEFSKEVVFRVGQRVEVDLPIVPKEQRDVTTGIITECHAKFFATPEVRKINYTIRLDNKGNYIKKKYWLMEGLQSVIITEANNLKLISDFALSLEEETCKWHKKGNLEGVCTETNKPIFHDLFEKAQDNLGHITYCPFCGGKIERI